MNIYELLTLVLILALAFGGAFLLHAHFGMVGYIVGFLGGGLLLPVGVWVVLKLLPKRSRKTP